MRGSVIGVGVGFLLGALGAWLIKDGFTIREPPSGDDSTMLADLVTRTTQIDLRLGLLTEQIQRIGSAPVPAADISRKEVTPVDSPPPLATELVRLKAEIERLTASAKSGAAMPLTVEDLRRDLHSPPNWAELEKLNSSDACDEIKFSTEGELLRCFGKPSRIVGSAAGPWWYYSGGSSGRTWGFEFQEGRVVHTAYYPRQ